MVADTEMLSLKFTNILLRDNLIFSNCTKL